MAVPIAVQLRPRGRRGQVPVLAARRRGAAGAALQRDGLLPRRRRRAADGARAVVDVGRLPACRSRSGARRSSTTTRTPAGSRCGTDTLERWSARRVRRGLPDARRVRRASCWARRRWLTQLEQLVDSLLYEGYALYPYTPGATKNATPTPFGIVYPPRYAAGAREHLRPPRAALLVLAAPPDGVLRAEVRFLAASGERHRARRAPAGDAGGTLGELRGGARLRKRAPSAADEGDAAVDRDAPGSATRSSDGACEVALRVENRTSCPRGLDRAGALRRSLLSTHPLLRVTGGRFVSPLERPCASVNTFPVLATAADDAVLGAAIVLPDHPQIAPESRGGLFDSTEIEEALLLHVHALSDAEREQIEPRIRAVREMIERAAAATPEEILALHGRVTMRDPGDGSDPPTTEPPRRRRAGRSPRRRGRGGGRRGALPARREGRAAPGRGRRPARAHARRAHRDGRADLDRLRRQDAPRRDDRRRSRPGAAARQRPLLFFFAAEVEVLER